MTEPLPLPGLHGLVLAAGAGARLGGNKPLYRFEGRALLALAVEASLAACGAGVSVIVQPCADEVAECATALGAAFILSREWRQGMAASLRSGIEAVPPHSDGALISVCDQPLVGALELRALARAWQEDRRRIAAAWYAGAPGVPAIFPRAEFALFRALSGDRGAKQALIERQADLALVPMEKASADLDCIADGVRLAERSRTPL